MFAVLQLLGCLRWRIVATLFCLILPFSVMAFQLYSEEKALKITNVADGSVLDLATSSTSNNARIITFKWFGTDNQKWIVQLASEAWHMRSLVQRNEIKCLKQMASTNRVLHVVCDNSLDQQWYAQRISSNADIYMIINYKSGQVLTSKGHLKQVTCEQLDETNPSQQWSFEDF